MAASRRRWESFELPGPTVQRAAATVVWLCRLREPRESPRCDYYSSPASESGGASSEWCRGPAQAHPLTTSYLSHRSSVRVEVVSPAGAPAGWCRPNLILWQPAVSVLHSFALLPADARENPRWFVRFGATRVKICASRENQERQPAADQSRTAWREEDFLLLPQDPVHLPPIPTVRLIRAASSPRCEAVACSDSVTATLARCVEV
jgi:hypothetical protein